MKVDPAGEVASSRSSPPIRRTISQLGARISTGTVREVILATNPSLEGEATALYVQRQLASLPLTISRIARGLPVGGDLEYADELTLGRAFEGRRLLDV